MVHIHALTCPETSGPTKEHTQHPVSPNPDNPSNIRDTTVSLEGDSNPISVSSHLHTHVHTTTASLEGVMTSPQGESACAKRVHQSQFLLHVPVPTAALQLLTIS